MHQITRGISILNTGNPSAPGSITRGTPALYTTSYNEPLDLSMDVVHNEETEYPRQNVVLANNFYDMKNFSLLPPQQLRIAPTPPTSPHLNLCIIQEENSCMQPNSSRHEEMAYQHMHPQICLTDVQGSEITLVALSDSR